MFVLICVYTIAWPILTCIELLINLHNDQHLFADGFVTVGPIAMEFEWD